MSQNPTSPVATLAFEPEYHPELVVKRKTSPTDTEVTHHLEKKVKVEQDTKDTVDVGDGLFAMNDHMENVVRGETKTDVKGDTCNKFVAMDDSELSEFLDKLETRLHKDVVLAETKTDVKGDTCNKFVAMDRLKNVVRGETKDRSLCVYPGCNVKHLGNGSGVRCESHYDEDMSKPDWMCLFQNCEDESAPNTFWCDEHPNGEDNEFDRELFRCHKCRVVNHYDSGSMMKDGHEHCAKCVPLNYEL